MEYWKLIRGGFKSNKHGYYWVSSLGRFKNGKGKILTSHPHKKGYVMISLWRDGREGRHQAHRLVAKAFIPNPDQLPQVNHMDGVKKNNAVSNLQWCTNLQNKKHAMANGLCGKSKTGGDNPGSHLTDAQAAEIRQIKLPKGPNKGLSRKMIAQMYNVTEHVIKDIRLGKTYKY